MISFFTDPAILSLLAASFVLLLAQLYTNSVINRPPSPKMKAWVVVKNGPPGEALAYKEVGESSGSLPKPKGSDILIKVTHAALNPADLHFMNVIPTWVPFRRHATPGMDFAGEVVSMGPQAAAAPSHASSPLAVGAAVAGCMSVGLVATGHGSLVEYVTVPAELVAKVPATLGASLDKAGPVAVGLLGCAGQTAHLAATEPAAEAAFRKSNARVLINGASGGVGSLLIQICKGRGAYVAAVCSAGNADFVTGLGADEVIDYKAHDPLPNYLANTLQYTGALSFDLIFDCVGDQLLFSKSPAYLTPQGSVLCIVGGGLLGTIRAGGNRLVPSFLGGTPRGYKLLALGPSGQRARAVAAWVENATLQQMPIDSEYGMADVVAAYEKLATKRARGKIVIKVQPDTTEIVDKPDR
ncbi:zinc ion binding [Sporothrix eucalyptigena]|uniref:Zinc ion binding n=1 Tax=Sporothrix eucalyptigena TaxID=1812306 RepID=A0ABP0CHB7_9PEZI